MRIIVVGLVLNLGGVYSAEEDDQKDSAERLPGQYEAPSPNGKFAFRYVTDAATDSDAEADEDAGVKKQRYELIDKKSGKAIMTVAKSDPDLGASARFNIEGVLWRRDSSAFAMTAFLWKRGSSVFVFRREGSRFRKVKLPEMATDVPEKVKRGKSYPHVAELDSETARRWLKDGSLVVEIESMFDGGDGSITAKRTVTLGFGGSGKASILKSTVKYDTETKADPDAEAGAARDKGNYKTAIKIYDRAIKADGDDAPAYYGRGCTYFVMRDWTKALADFQRHCDLRKEEAYPAFPARFFIWILRARLGDRETADKEFAPYMEGHPAQWSGGGDAMVGNFLLGRISEDEFVASLRDNPQTAYFYAGIKRLLNNERESAAEDFRKSVATGEKDATEYQMAAAELKALTD